MAEGECPFCGQPVSPDDEICKKCGQMLKPKDLVPVEQSTPDTVDHPSDSKEIGPHGKCPICGSPHIAEYQEAVGKDTRMVTGIAGFLLLGPLGLLGSGLGSKRQYIIWRQCMRCGNKWQI